MEALHLSVGRAVNGGQEVIGVWGIPSHLVENMAKSIGCSIMESKFRYLGVMVGENMSRCKAWDEVLVKLNSRLSRWKAKTLSIGGRLDFIEVQSLAPPFVWMAILRFSWTSWDKGVGLLRYKGGARTLVFGLDIWSGDRPAIRGVFPRMFALELNRDISVAEKLSSPLEGSFRRSVRSGLEQDQCLGLSAVMEQVSLSSTVQSDEVG
ncbi:hypothetical protein Tco_0842482 [Tanacetum coccineum]|uniref:Uncharacterized protein n=1 Tax=Tanacetum coccineum TaxID=301880 RepID=A0ABQ5AZY4_9ASTR